MDLMAASGGITRKSGTWDGKPEVAERIGGRSKFWEVRACVMGFFVQQDPEGSSKLRDVRCAFSLNMAAASANAVRPEIWRFPWMDSEVVVDSHVHGRLCVHSCRLRCASSELSKRCHQYNQNLMDLQSSYRAVRTSLVPLIHQRFHWEERVHWA